VRACADRFAAVWRETHGGAPLPKIGLGRFVVSEERERCARRGAPRHKRWYEVLHFLSSLMGVSHRPFFGRPRNSTRVAEDGRAFSRHARERGGIRGEADGPTRRRITSSAIRVAGNLTARNETLRSIVPFRERRVMPMLRRASVTARLRLREEPMAPFHPHLGDAARPVSRGPRRAIPRMSVKSHRRHLARGSPDVFARLIRAEKMSGILGPG